MATEEQLQEIHRLALLGDERAIAQQVTDRLAGAWTDVSRFREVRDLCRKTVAVGRTPQTLSYLARATSVLGDRVQALRLYFEARQMCEEASDRAGLATTLNNIGSVYAGTGEPARALEYLQQALPLIEAVGDRAGKRVTRYNIAVIYWVQGRLPEAVDGLRQVVTLDAQVHSPHLASDRALLAQAQVALERA